MPNSSPHTESPPSRRKWRWWIPLTIALAVIGTVGWFFITEQTLRTHALQIFSTIGLTLIALWYIFLTGNSGRKKIVLSSLLLTLFVTFAVAASLGWIRAKPAGSGWFSFEFGPPEPLPALELDGNPGPTPPSDPSFQGAEARYLGPDGDGSIPGAPLVTDWVKSPPVEIWRRRIGSGWSSFAVAKGKAVTLEQRDNDELTVCYALETGDPLWVSKNPVRFFDSMGGHGPRATPTIAGDHVYSLGATGILKCLDLASGDLVWSRDTLTEFDSGNITYGKSSAPLISGENVIVSGGNYGPTLIALRRSDGETVWKSGDRKPSYASPVIATLCDVPQILSVNAESLTGHDPETGDELWEFPWPGTFPKVGQPVTIDGSRVLVTAAYGSGSFLVEIKKSPDGTWQTAQLWRSERLKTKFSSAVVHGEYAYGIDSGRFTCVSLKDGQRVWKDGRYGFGQNLLIGDVALVQTERGPVVLVAADPSGHRELARLPALDAKTWAAPTLAGEFLLVRSEDEVACYRIPRNAKQ